jgi:hypothetical protein
MKHLRKVNDFPEKPKQEQKEKGEVSINDPSD